MIEVEYSKLVKIQQKLLLEAEKVMNTAYNPYSKFYVGAALLARTGEIIAGSNVENATYSSICAERSAIVKANSMDLRVFDKVAIIAKGNNFNTVKVTGPCGTCRQMLFELSQISRINLEVILSTTLKDKIVVATIDELLPLGFGPRDLDIDLSQFQK